MGDTRMDLEHVRRTGYELAEAMAPGWQHRRAFIEAAMGPVAEWMIRELAPQPGDTWLELAARAGETGFEAARRVGDAGRLISTDFSPAIVDVARRRGAALGIDNVDYQVLDAERIELNAGSVDGVLCRLGYMLMADPAAAMAETRRVIRTGGRLVLAVWDAPERNPFFATLANIAVERRHMSAPEPASPGSFSPASRRHTRTLLEGPGFSIVRIEEVPVCFRPGTFWTPT